MIEGVVGRAIEVVVVANRLRVWSDGHGPQLQLEELRCKDDEEADGRLEVDICSKRSVWRGDLFD